MRIGTPAKRKTSDTKLKEARLRAARANPAWTEIENDLIARGPLLVSAASDQCFKLHTGVVWERGTSAMVADMAPLHWYEPDDGGEPVFIELLHGTWTERYEKQLRRRRVAS